jgi:hypothetical protein
LISPQVKRENSPQNKIEMAYDTKKQMNIGRFEILKILGYNSPDLNIIRGAIGGPFFSPWGYVVWSLDRIVQCNHVLGHFLGCRLVAYDILLVHFQSHFGPVVWMPAVSFVVSPWCAYHTHHYRYFFLLSSLSDNG